jgi:hypothetical protein
MGTITKLAYILAASHSGSTLLAMLLGSHPEICTVGELKFTSLGSIEQYRCSCREYIRNCSFWSGIADDMAQRGIPFCLQNACSDIRALESRYAKFLLAPLHRSSFLEWMRDMALSFSADWKQHLPKTQALNSILARCISERTAKRIIVDSSKVGLRLKYLLRNPDLDVKVIRLIRDGRAVALTYTDPERFADAEEPGLRGGGMGKNRESERLSMRQAAREWRRSNEEGEVIVRRLERSRWIEVRYEEICARTDETLRRLYQFLQVDPDQPRRDFRGLEHHVIGNGMRLDSTSNVILDERWRSVLNHEELRSFDSEAGKLNRKYGYT